MYGVGYFYPSFYDETINDIKTGKYGSEIKNLFNKTKSVTVDAEYEIYWCPECGYFNDPVCLDLYKPTNSETAESSSSYFIPDFYGDENYILFKEYEHMCPKCGKLMQKVATKKEQNDYYKKQEEAYEKGERTKTGEDIYTIKINKLTCPECGEKYQAQEDFTIYD